jgi:hypothetical protein
VSPSTSSSPAGDASSSASGRLAAATRGGGCRRHADGLGTPEQGACVGRHQQPHAWVGGCRELRLVVTPTRGARCSVGLMTRCATARRPPDRCACPSRRRRRA